VTPEGLVKKKIKALLVQHNVYYAMPLGAGFGAAGVPDFLCCVDGIFLAVEAKAGKGKTTPLQDRQIAAIQAAGGHALVIRETNINELEEKILWIRKNSTASAM
jgi:hypothetical protein